MTIPASKYVPITSGVAPMLGLSLSTSLTPGGGGGIIGALHLNGKQITLNYRNITLTKVV